MLLAIAGTCPVTIASELTIVVEIVIFCRTMDKNKSRTLIALIIGLVFIFMTVATVAAKGGLDFSSYEWTEVNGYADWEPRAGLQVVELRNQFYLMGGRTPNPPTLPPVPGMPFGACLGKTRARQEEVQTDDTTHWPARAYFQAVTHRSICAGWAKLPVIDNPIALLSL